MILTALGGALIGGGLYYLADTWPRRIAVFAIAAGTMFYIG